MPKQLAVAASKRSFNARAGELDFEYLLDYPPMQPKPSTFSILDIATNRTSSKPSSLWHNT
jgi:hypothetical protein